MRLSESKQPANSSSPIRPYAQLQELPFQEQDFAVWMDELESELLQTPAWRQLLTYKGVSLYDAAYATMYWTFLQAYRRTYGLEDSIEQENGYDSSPFGRGKAIMHRLVNRDLGLLDAINIAGTRLRDYAEMQLPAQRLPDLPEPKRILVLRVSKNQSAFPVLSSLREQGAAILFASWSESLRLPVEKLGLAYMDLRHHYRRRYQGLLTVHGRAVNEILMSADLSLPCRLLDAINGHSLNGNASQFLKSSLAMARVYIDLYMDLLHAFHPETVLLFNENSFSERTMALTARAAGIPSVAVQHGLFIGYVYRNLAADKMIVWGELPRKFWLERGCEPEQVISVGAIAHEMWSQRSPKPTLMSRRAGWPTVLVVGQNPAAFLSPGMHSRTIKAVMRSVKLLPAVHFVIKVHPGEEPGPYRDAISNTHADNVQLITDGPIESLLAYADLVITVFSTVGVEAMLSGCPVLVLNLSSHPPLAPYTIASRLVQNEDRLAQEIELLLNDQAVRADLVRKGRDFADQYLGVIDGGAASRAAREILLLHKRS